MAKAFLDVLLSVLASLIQIIVLPLNLLITSLMPDISDKILELSTTLNGFFNGITWGLGLLPNSLVATLLFIIGVEIARYSIFISSHIITRIFDIIRKIKFW